jgi:hypothetical protein
MFYTGWTIASAIIVMLGAILIGEPLRNRKLLKLDTYLMAVALLAGLYLLACGIDLAIGWQDPFANVSAADVAEVHHGRRGGLLILLVRVWPYALITLGLYFTYNIGLGLRWRFKKQQ